MVAARAASPVPSFHLSRRDRLVAAALVTLVVLCLAAALWVYRASGADARESMQGDLFRYLLQLSLIGVIGGAIAVLYKWIEQQLQAARERAAMRRDFIARLGNAYRAVKETRRVLRAFGISSAYRPGPTQLSPQQVQIYDEQLAALNRAQLSLEALQIEARYSDVSDDKPTLLQALGSMEKYLSQIVTEFERERPVGAIAYGNLSLLDEFTKKSANAPQPHRFAVQFQEAHRTAIRCVAGR